MVIAQEIFELCDGSLGCDCPSRKAGKKRVFKHGNRTSYQRGCRCTLCRNANAAYSRKLYGWKARKKSVPGHGTTARYQRGCRCKPCKAAKSAYDKQWHQKKKKEKSS